MTREEAAKKILELVGFVQGGHWWGHDTAIASEKELIDAALAILNQVGSENCHWATDIHSTICPKHKVPICNCPLPQFENPT